MTNSLLVKYQSVEQGLELGRQLAKRRWGRVVLRSLQFMDLHVLVSQNIVCVLYGLRKFDYASVEAGSLWDGIGL